MGKCLENGPTEEKGGRHLASRCPLCGKEEESLDHLLLHCSKTHKLWTVVFAIFGVNWVLPSSLKETLLGWKDPFARKILKKIWMVAPLCLFWTIWRERNRTVFKDVLTSTQRMKNSLVFALWSWQVYLGLEYYRFFGLFGHYIGTSLASFPFHLACFFWSLLYFLYTFGFFPSF